MDENSCKGETSKGVEDTVNKRPEEKMKKNSDCNQTRKLVPEVMVPGAKIDGTEDSRPGVSALETSGPSFDLPPPLYQERENKIIVTTPETFRVAQVAHPQVSSNEHLPEAHTAPEVRDNVGSERPSVGPPPSYSFVMKQKRKTPERLPSDSSIIHRPPPPTYSGIRDLFITPENTHVERICSIQPIWRSHSQPAVCPRCGVLILTTTHSHDSVATHVAALALCLFGCWPCCLLPYCMNVCKNTYHHCPICQTFLGAYTPW